MEKNVEKDDAEAAASGPSGRRHAGTPDGTAAAVEREQAANERESRQRGRPKKPRESLHAWIVHFDPERSSGPLASSDET
ncbi:hypothetical protein CI15_26200 [Paraburkholderia monticola]|uniref:Uncharacterized protein n=1 Tax=Paraburkholderia monticola TaxID=1399968 RepID=A0A149PG48_9BURK|nr:hypothetical protein [Paraburkholderia monticola]KXU84004.1 hypothetical protein CI15_26200 [Paraburkholderia monticola]